MTAGDAAPLILTALLDDASQARFERERQRFFPPGRNLIAAHVTLFHHLPGLEQAAVDRQLAAICEGRAPVPFAVTGLRSLGRGTAYALDMPDIATLRRHLATAWAPWLTAQDRQGWRPHVTIQNKVSPGDAKRLQATLMAGFAPWAGHVTGLRLWRYLGGPWESLHAYCFSAPIVGDGTWMYH